ncbi:hypothetical protein DL93DRAFT_2116748 [Clavulina sp. PMI_390]|nr:hypothetical protein DL93DRAFT_2116748 [Clavulina sp. PMI_390]
MPVMSVREILENGSEVYRGDAFVNRSRSHELEGLDERQEAEAENKLKKAGDPTIMWGLAFRLDPSLHGRGLMTAIMKFIIHKWAVPHLGAKHFISVTFWDNIGSQKVALKNGFRLVGTSRLPGDLTKTHN